MGLKNRILSSDLHIYSRRPTAEVPSASAGRRAAEESASAPRAQGVRTEGKATRPRQDHAWDGGAVPEAGVLQTSPTPRGTVLMNQCVSLKRTRSPSGGFLDAPSG